jgi:(p)ppGpp synthase/HD superfamily hydrolase
MTTPPAQDIELRACQFATNAHAGINQVKRYSGEPYINHPATVVELVRSRPHTPEMLAAAWLHDVVEDTGVPIERIQEAFGEAVAALVADLTDVSRPEDGNRAARKAIDRKHAAKTSPAAKTIKLADLIDNTRSIVARDPGFAKVYLVEKRLLLEVLKEGDHVLWQMASDQAGEGAWGEEMPNSASVTWLPFHLMDETFPAPRTLPTIGSAGWTTAHRR